MKVMITGISSGIGKTLVKQLITSGHEILGITHNMQKARKLYEELDRERLQILGFDYQKTSRSLMYEMLRNFNDTTLDAIVFNSGINFHNHHEYWQPNYAETFRVNHDSVMFWVSNFLPRFAKRKRGLFVFISSTAAFRKGPGDAAYSASKAAVSMAFRRLNLQYRNEEVGFSTIYLSAIDTDLWKGSRNYFVPSAEKAAEFIRKTLNKPGKEYFFPFFPTLLARLSLLVPNRFFHLLKS